MTVLRKVPARAGLQWVMGSLLLLRLAPLALGRLGVLWAVAMVLVLTISANIYALAAVGPYLLLLAVPVFMGGLLWAVREVDYGRTPHPFHLLAGVYGERPVHLMLFLFPQVMVSLLSALVLFLVLGTEGIQELLQHLVKLGPIPAFDASFDQAQREALLSPLAFGSLLLWLSWGTVIFGMLLLMVWVMLPLVMFENINGVSALRYSLYACAYNLGAMAVCALSLCGVMGVVYVVLVQMVQAASDMIGPGVAVLLAQLVMIAILMPLLAGAMYAAWKHMLAPDNLPPPPLPRNLLQA